MRKIEAIIRKSRFEDVKAALLDADIEWLSYYDVRGIGKSRQGRIYRGVVYDTSSIERTMISLVVRDKNVDKTVKAILSAARTGECIYIIASIYMSLFPSAISQSSENSSGVTVIGFSQMTCFPLSSIFLL